MVICRTMFHLSNLCGRVKSSPWPLDFICRSGHDPSSHTVCAKRHWRTLFASASWQGVFQGSNTAQAVCVSMERPNFAGFLLCVEGTCQKQGRGFLSQLTSCGRVGVILGGGDQQRKFHPGGCGVVLQIKNEMITFSVNKSKNKGLISADRRTKPTLMLTIPHSYKVVYNGFISSNV